MKESKRARMRPLTSDGIQLSRPCKVMMRQVALIAKEADKVGPSFWRRLSPDPGDALQMADANLLHRLCRMHWHNIFVASEAVVDFLKNSEVRAQDIKPVGEIVNRKLCLHDDGIFIHLAGEIQSIFALMVGVEGGSTTRPDGLLASGLICWARGCGKQAYDIGYLPLTVDFANPILTQGENVHIWRTVLNLALYMDAFPECVTEGPPELVRGSVAGEASTTIAAHEAIRRNYTDRKQMPHLRRGHFRFLQSDRYTTKRFQAVYVRPSVVRGSAETVHPPDSTPEPSTQRGGA